MNYLRIYNSIVDRAKSSGRIKLDKNNPDYIYYEEHHIVPEHFFKARTRPGPVGWLEGNAECPTNLVLLTPEEHYVAHQLLVKIYPQHSEGLVYALKMMTVSDAAQKRNNKLYGWIKRRYSGIGCNHEKRKKISNSLRGNVPWNKGRKCPEISAGLMGKPSPMKGKENGQKGKPRPSISKALKGKPSVRKGIRKVGHPVLCIELNKIFQSMQEAAAFVGLKTSGNIRKVAKGLPGYKKAKGYTWKFVTFDELSKGN